MAYPVVPNWSGSAPDSETTDGVGPGTTVWAGSQTKEAETNPQDPFGHNPFSPESLSYDPLGRVPYAGPPAGPPPGPPVFPPPPPHRPPVNTFATLSLVFAFVFAPVGAVLGHLGLAQIRRTGELGRDRALIGLSVSYAFITLTVVALTGWTTLNTLGAVSRSTQAAGPATTASPTTTTSESPKVPTVAPDDVSKLLPKLDALKSITNDQNLEAGATFDRPTRSDKDATIDRPQCWGSMIPGAPEAYTVDAIQRYRGESFSDTQTLLKSSQISEVVIAFRDPSTARSQVTALVDGWRDCGGAPVTLTARGGPTYTLSLSPPADAGNGISTMDLAPKGLKVRFVRAAAAKANIVVDLYVVSLGTTDASGPRQTAVSIANYILNKIPD
jgi:eukaryotic-like serine/threonine-protein kinase